MSDYIKITDYAAKDALLTGDPAKLVKGAEIGADFDAVAVAVATKLDSSDIGVSVQAYDADLATWAGVTPGTGVTTFLATPTSANLAAAVTDETGSGALVFATSPTLTTPNIGVATATSVNGTTIPSSKTLVVTTDVGVSVQAYDANTAKTNVAQNFSAAQRGSVTTDNDLSFDISATNHFSCTPSAGGTLTFTNIAAGRSGIIFLVNGSNYSIAAHTNTKINSADLTAISASGTYLLTYFSPDGTNVYVVASKGLTA